MTTSSPSYRVLMSLGCALAMLLLSGCMAMNPKHDADAHAATVDYLPPSVLAASDIKQPTTIPVLGPERNASISGDTDQVVVVTAADAESDRSTLSRWERTASGWTRIGIPTPAHNGYRGWSDDRREGDGTSPIGTFTLTAAAGRLPDPGAQLPYEHDNSYFRAEGTFMGGDLAGSFDYVVAIDYNRVPGAPVSDSRRPDGAKYGGGVWLHVDHDSPTQACVSIDHDEMRVMAKWLDPAKNPVVVMGPQSYVGG